MSGGSTGSISDDNKDFPFTEVFGLFATECLLIGGVYSYAVIYSKLCLSEQVSAKDGLWFPIAYYSSWLITYPFCRTICKALKKREYLRISMITFTCLLLSGKILALLSSNTIVKLVLQGLTSGICINFIQNLVKDSLVRLDCKRFAVTSNASKAIGLFVVPHLMQVLITQYGITNADLFFSVILIVIFPTIFVLLKKPKQPLLVITKYKTVSNDLDKDLYEFDYGSEEFEEEDVEEFEQSKVVNKNGVEILPTIEEEVESEMNLKLEEKGKFLRVNFFYCLVPILITKVTTSLTAAIYITLVPYLAQEHNKGEMPVNVTEANFLLSLMAVFWLLFLLLFWFATTKLRRHLTFLVGLTFTSTSLYTISTSFSLDMINISSVVFGFGHGALTYTEEKVYGSFAGPKRKSVINVSDFLSGTLVIILYTVFYVVEDFGIEKRLFHLLFVLNCCNIFLWILAPILRFFIKFKCFRRPCLK